jgi:predicted RNase H-like nuclease (RuvC/YqgF family)
MSLYIEDYSERAIALFGNTVPYKNKIMEIGGKFNPLLKVSNSEDRRAGFIFPKTKRTVVQQLIDDINSGSIEPGAVEEKSNNYTKSVSSSSSSRSSQNSVNNSVNNNVEVSKTDFMNLLSKVERLEQEVNNLKQQLSGKSDSTKMSTKTKVVDEKEVEKDEDDIEEEMPKKRLLRRS